MAFVFIVNGKGGVGKDTFCDAVEEVMCDVVKHISSITPVKDTARMAGWNGSKELKDRKFLSELKSLMTEYNDRPTEYCFEEYKKFIAQHPNGILFIDIREAKEIDKFIKHTEGRAKTLLVRRSAIDGQDYNNISDDDVFNYDYDYTFFNDGPLENLKEDVKEFMCEVLECEKRKIYPHNF